MRRVSGWLAFLALMGICLVLTPLLLLGRLPTRLEALLIGVGMVALLLAVRILRGAVLARLPLARDQELQSLFVPPLRLAPEPAGPQHRRALAERHRGRLDRLRRFRYYPSWGPVAVTAGLLAQTGHNPWWWLLALPSAAVAVPAALEPFRLRRAVARLAQPSGVASGAG